MANSGDKIYSEEEVGRLLKLAIHEAETDKLNKQQLNHGLTLEEIKKIATESGINPEYVNVALRKLNNPPLDESVSGFFGAPTSLNLEIRVPGKLSDDTVAQLLRKIRKISSSQRGQYEYLDNHFNWTNSSINPTLHITADSDTEGYTTINVDWKLTDVIILTHMWSALVLFIGSLLSLGFGSAALLASIMATSAVLFFIARWVVKKVYKKQHGQLNDMLSDLASIAETTHTDQVESVNLPVSETAVTAPSPSISIDGDDVYQSDSGNTKQADNLRSKN